MKLEKIVGFFKSTLRILNENFYQRYLETDYKNLGIGAPSECDMKKLNDYKENIYTSTDIKEGKNGR